MDSDTIEHFLRHYTSSQYMLPADEEEKDRLALQHRCLKMGYGNRLFLAPVTLAPGDRVLDSGVGGGSWLLDLMGQVSSAVSLYGIDIEPRLFPSDPAPNIHLSTDSITKLPASWSSTFTLVHQRYLFLALTLPEWQAALKEMHRVLVPGGWINLTEALLDVLQFSWTPGPGLTKLFTHVCAVCRARGVIPDLPDRLPALVEEAGFVNIKTEKRGLTTYGEDGAALRDNSYRAMIALKKPLLDAGQLESEEEYDNLVNTATKEWAEIPEAVIETCMVYAQKPPS